MGSFGGFYKGEKKKIKKSILEDRSKKMISSQAPVFVLPKLIRKDRKSE